MPVMALDPEELLWKPGSKLISVPAPLPSKVISVCWDNQLATKVFKSRYSWVADQTAQREIETTTLYEQFGHVQQQVENEMIRNYRFDALKMPNGVNGGYVRNDHFVANERAGHIPITANMRYIKVRDEAAGVVHNRLEMLLVPTRA